MKAINKTISTQRLNIFRFFILVLFCFGIVLNTLYINFYLNNLTSQITSDFRKQNYIEMESEKIIPLSIKLNTISANNTWSCISAKQNNIKFFEKNHRGCGIPFINKSVTLKNEPKNSLEIIFTVTLPAHLLFGSISFILLQALLLLILLKIFKNVETIRHENKFRLEKELSEITSNLAHNIRNPLNTLSLLASNLNTSQENQNTIRNSISQIINLSSNVLDKYRTTNKITQSENQTPKAKSYNVHLVSMVSSVIENFKIINPNIKFEFEINIRNQSLFSKININEFKSILINVIENAIHSNATNLGTIKILLEKKENMNELSIIDEGCGIPQSVLDRLLHEKTTYGKSNGTGLGLFHANQYLKSINSSIQINNNSNQPGTTVIILLKSCDAPEWFCNPQKLIENKNLITLGTNSKNNHFTKVSEFLKWILQHEETLAEKIFLFNYEIDDQSKTGLDLLKSLKGKTTSYLTSYRTDTEFYEILDNEKISFIPKSILKATTI